MTVTLVRHFPHRCAQCKRFMDFVAEVQAEVRENPYPHGQHSFMVTWGDDSRDFECCGGQK